MINSPVMSQQNYLHNAPVKTFLLWLECIYNIAVHSLRTKIMWEQASEKNIDKAYYLIALLLDLKAGSLLA